MAEGPPREKVQHARRAMRRKTSDPVPPGQAPAPAVRTVKLSKKMLATLVGAVGAQTVAFAVNWIASGQFDRVELAQLVGIAATAVFGVVSGYTAQPDNQTRST